ncbi:MAG: hypothetical protein RIQ79_1052 [Verrucomicrobiota bacterium]
MTHTPSNSSSLPIDHDELANVGFIARYAQNLAAIAVLVSTVVASVVMMPPSRYPELAYLFAAPAVYWAYFSPGWKIYSWTIFCAQAISWTLTLGWLKNVTWIGLLLLGPFIGAWMGAWFMAVRWTMPRMLGRPWTQRVGSVLGLAGVWIVLEWTRSWMLGGFPWLTLSATQWQRLSVLQPAAYTGAWGVSFVLITVNVAFAAYAHKLIKGTVNTARTRCPEFIAAMVLLLGCLLLTVRETFNRGRYHVAWANVGIIQPAIPQSLKWDIGATDAVLRTLEDETLKAAAMRPDLLLWPEATTPLAVFGDPGMKAWTESLVRKSSVPLLMGSIGRERVDTPDESWVNGVFLVTPENGLDARYYTKRHLVPFGEYVPIRPVLGWLEKVVPVGDDFAKGHNASLIEVRLDRNGINGAPSVTQVGSLICYEDIFPSLARESVLAGAEVLVVNTNNGWFGEGAAAYQHAAHSVLRAVETRRPVIRAGNAGWSGWIDECGAIRAVLTKNHQTGDVNISPGEHGVDPGTVYFRGSASVQVTRDTRFIGVQTLYVRWGDWFVGLSMALTLGTWLMLRRPYVHTVKPEKIYASKFL